MRTPSAPLGAPAPARPQDWHPIPAAAPGLSPRAKAFTRKADDGARLLVVIDREMFDAGDWRWHLSISTATRNPTWEEIAKARYDLLPDEITVAMYLPPRGEYVNAHPYCFHLTETKER